MAELSKNMTCTQKFSFNSFKVVLNRKILLFIFPVVFLTACVNPFAPKLANAPDDNGGVADQSTINGVFENFKYAYAFKDTLIYGNLLSDDFTFTYHDYDVGIVKSWGRQEEMVSTFGMFQAAQNLDLQWFDVSVSASTPDSLITDISRGFSLSIVFSASDIVNLQGRASLRLKRSKIGDIWKITMWRDESNY